MQKRLRYLTSSYNDPEIGIDWSFELIGGIEKLIISEKDKKLMSLEEYRSII